MRKPRRWWFIGFIAALVFVSVLQERDTQAVPYCPPGSTAPICNTHNPPPPPPPVSTVLELDFKRWNQNPLGPGCKNDALLSFNIPPGTTLESITIGESSCSARGTDRAAGEYVDSHTASDIKVGAMVINRRPPKGWGPGQNSLTYHWWFNQWGDVHFHLCVNVRHPKKSVPQKNDVFDHLNMDDGLKAYKINTPVCIDQVGVKVDINIETGDVEHVEPDIAAKACDNGSVWWFGCKNDKGVPVTF